MHFWRWRAQVHALALTGMMAAMLVVPPAWATGAPKPVPRGMERLASLPGGDWTGSIEGLVSKLAEQSGYQFVVSGTRPQSPIVVTAKTEGVRVARVLFEAGTQAGERADIVVRIADKSIELRYRDSAPKETANDQNLLADHGAAVPSVETKASSPGFIGLLHTGRSKIEVPVVKGFAKDLPLIETVKQIAPASWAIIPVNEAFAMDASRRTASWSGGKSWVHVLDTLALAQDLAIEVDWTNQRLIVGSTNNAISKSASAVAQAAPNDGKNGAEPLHAKPEQPWNVLISDALLSKTMRRWGDRAGYQVIWDSPKDFPVMAAASFGGSFENAVNAVVDALASSEAPVEARFYSNSVVRFTRYSGQSSELRR